MPRDEGLDEATHAVEEVLLTFTVVMDVDIDVGDVLAAEIREQVEELRMIFLLRIVEAVLRRTAGGVGMLARNLGPTVSPRRYSLASGLMRGLASVRLPMVGDRRPHPSGFGRPPVGKSV